MNRLETLARLNSERDYEDKLVKELYTYFIASLDSIPEIGKDKINRIRERLWKIVTDSERHSHIFNSLIGDVLEDGADNY